MKIVIFFYILLILRSVDGLLCNGFNESVSGKVDSSNIVALRILTQQSLQPTEEKICHVYMKYTTDTLWLRFTKTLIQFPQINGKLVSHTLIQSQNNTPIQQNTLQHACSTHDYCDMDFVLHHLDWFINNGYNDDLVKHIFPLLNGEQISLGYFQFTSRLFSIDFIFFRKVLSA